MYLLGKILNILVVHCFLKVFDWTLINKKIYIMLLVILYLELWGSYLGEIFMAVS
jgi:hypothetical protein